MRGRNSAISDGYESRLLQAVLARVHMKARRVVLAMTDIVGPEQHTCYEQVLTISPYPLLGPSSPSLSLCLNQMEGTSTNNLILTTEATDLLR
jgi:hypothetical protein